MPLCQEDPVVKRHRLNPCGLAADGNWGPLGTCVKPSWFRLVEKLWEDASKTTILTQHVIFLMILGYPCPQTCPRCIQENEIRCNFPSNQQRMSFLGHTLHVLQLIWPILAQSVFAGEPLEPWLHSFSLSDNLSVCCLNPLFTYIYIHKYIYYCYCLYNRQKDIRLCDTYHIMGTNHQIVQCLS